MTWFNMAISIAILCATVTLLVVALIRGGAKKEGLSQKFLDDEQAKALREWDEAR
ncbi:hypothetical protein [Pseudorhizobium flavum]|uniref:Uncharacterized protein n=1 Tax=Pseudorhizobium flavum TaxID=1335061 RepID=A0A7W9Z1K6_9HYPH|nr:hypothetical protein [Pseudorhizobium flavum]MBB6182352.1 hypothetical protein [Pseudorhizobium flavum]